MEMAFAPGNDQLKVEQWSPQPSPSVDPAVSIFENIANGDILLNHPYESFEPVLRLVEEAAEDPDVIAIKPVRPLQKGGGKRQASDGAGGTESPV